VNRDIGPVRLQIRAQQEVIEDTDTENRETRSGALTLGSKGSPTLSFGLTFGGQDVNRPDGTATSDNRWGQLDLDHTHGSKVQSHLGLTLRKERDQLQKSETNLATGDLRLRYQPSDTLNGNVRVTAEQRQRVVRLNYDPTIQALQERQHLGSLVPERPVLTLNSSSVLSYRPSRKWDHRILHRIRSETAVDDGVEFSRNDLVGYQLKWAPSTRFRSTTDLNAGKVMNLIGDLDRVTSDARQEFLLSFPAGLSLRLEAADVLARDRLHGTRDQETRVDFGAEKIASRTLTARTQVGYLRKNRGGTSGEGHVQVGATWTPGAHGLRVGFTGEIASIGGIDSDQQDFDSFRRLVELKVDARPREGLTVEAKLRWLAAGQNTLGEPGYSAKTIETRATYNF